jgi:hypothetical protein
MQARPFPREDEWTAEWHKLAKFRVYIVLFGANVNTLWCKLSHLFVVERGLIFESSVSEKCFSIIPFNLRSIEGTEEMPFVHRLAGTNFHVILLEAIKEIEH